MKIKDLKEYQELSKRTLPEHDSWEDRQNALVNYALGLTGEAGETGDLIKKEVFHGHAPEVYKVKMELGDVLHYVAGLATLYGLTLEDVATANIEKLRKRYPEGFSSDASIKRVDVHD